MATARVFKIDGAKHELREDEYTDWVEVGFRVVPGVKVRGVCKFLLLSTEPEFELYVTPINIDPEKPAMPVGYPVGLSRSTWPSSRARSPRSAWPRTPGPSTSTSSSDDHFIQQCLDIDREREAMFFDGLDKVPRGLCVCVFDGTDRLQHMFWRYHDADHPGPAGGSSRRTPQRHRGPLPAHGRPGRPDDGEVPGDGHAADGASPTTASARSAAAST